MKKAPLLLAISISLFAGIFFALLPSRLAMPMTQTFSNDAVSYHEGAIHIARSGFYSRDGVTPTAGREPGYSFFLAGIYKIFGEGNRTAIYIAQALLHLVATLFFFSEFRRVAGERTALMAAGFLLLLPGIFHGFFTVYRESLALSLFLLTIASVFRTQRTMKVWNVVLSGMLFGILILTYIPLMFFPFFMGAGLWYMRFKKQDIAIIIILPLLFLLGWGIRNDIHGEWQLLNPFRSAGTWRMRAIHAEMQDPLDPLRCLYSEYISHDRSTVPKGLCHPEDVLEVEWVEPFPETIPKVRALEREAKRRILHHLPMYLWGSSVWSIEYHLPFLNGWGFTYNLLESLGALLIYIGCGAFLLRAKKFWKREYILFILPILYGTTLFSLTQALPRYRVPIIFCYIAISAIGYASVKREKASPRT